MGVHAAHRVGLIHRDLKPSNVMVERTDDGGLQPLRDGLRPRPRLAAGPASRATGAVLGTPHYMSPEQARGEVARLDRRADVYSLGATLYSLLTGRPAVRRRQQPGGLLSQQPRAPVGARWTRTSRRTWRPSCSSAWRRSRSARYDSARALAEDLDRFLDGEPVRARAGGFLDRTACARRPEEHGPGGDGGSRLRRSWARGRYGCGPARGAAAGGARGRVRADPGRRRVALHVAHVAPLHDVRGYTRSPGARASAARRGADAPRRRAGARPGRATPRPGTARDGRGGRGPGSTWSARGAAATRARTWRTRWGWHWATSTTRDETVDGIGSKELREARRREIQQKYRDPATFYLRQSGGSDQAVPEYAEGLLAFYEKRYDAALDAAYSGAMLAILAVSGLVLGAWFKHSRQGVRNFAARFWHRLGSPCSYARWGVAIFGGATVAVLVYEVAIDLRRGADVSVSPITWAMGALALIAWIIVHRQHQRASHGVCIALWLLLVSAAPAAWIALGHQDVQMRGLLRDSLLSASRDVVQRQNAIASDLRRWASNADTRARDFPEARKLAQPSATMPVAGFAAGDCDNARADVGAWTVCVFGPPPLAGLITKRTIDFWRRESWTASAQDETQQRRIELLDAKEASNPSCTSAQSGETCLFQTADGRTLTMSIDLRHGGSPQAVDDETRFEIAMRAVFKLASFGAVLVLIYLLALFASRRLLGVREKHVHGTGSDVRPVQQAIVFYSRRLEAPAVEKALAAARSRATPTATDPTVTRVNLATDALFTELVDKGKLTGVVLLTNIDIALTDAARRRDILVALERLVDDPKVQLLIHSQSSPLERLYHPERYPESGADHTLSLDEALRWDNVLQKLEVRTVSEPEQPRRHAQLAAVDHHRIWKLSTRAERLLLYQLATDRLANPRNHAVIDALIARGLIRLNPWPDIVDPDFEAFVRTAENSKDLAEWQRQASQASGKRVRNTLITVSLVLVLIAVLWFNWSASDQFKIVSAILAASVAFLSQIGQAFNFIRSGAQRSGG